MSQTMVIEKSRFGFSTTLQRVRLRFSKKGEATQLSHLQQIQMIKKALELSQWPVARSNGKGVDLKISFGPVIPFGCESESEYCDVDLISRLNFKTAQEYLNPHLGVGYSLMELKSIPKFFPSLDETMNVALYEIQSDFLLNSHEKWENFWKQDSYFVIKKKKEQEVKIDARERVISWDLQGSVLMLTLRFGPGKTLKPEKIIQSLYQLEDSQIIPGSASTSLRVCRKQLYFEKKNGELLAP
ncbi:MAG: TIGR03936 family radical SAM-associated protein [Elusimicrobiota bacterium]